MKKGFELSRLSHPLVHFDVKMFMYTLYRPVVGFYIFYTFFYLLLLFLTIPIYETNLFFQIYINCIRGEQQLCYFHYYTIVNTSVLLSFNLEPENCRIGS